MATLRAKIKVSFIICNEGLFQMVKNDTRYTGISGKNEYGKGASRREVTAGAETSIRRSQREVSGSIPRRIKFHQPDIKMRKL